MRWVDHGAIAPCAGQFKAPAGVPYGFRLWAESLRRHSPTDRALTVAEGGKAVPMLLGFKHARCDQLLLLDLG
jgi:hypothetical protein